MIIVINGTPKILIDSNDNIGFTNIVQNDEIRTYFFKLSDDEVKALSDIAEDVYSQ